MPARTKGGGVVDKDRGWKALQKRLAEIGKGRFVAVGIQGDSASADHGEGLTNVLLGTYHEFGGKDDRPPERPFLRGTWDKNVKKYQGEIDKLGKQTFDPSSKKKPETSLLFIGETYKGDVQKAMKEGIPATKSGQVAHLIKTRQLWNSLSAQFVEEEAVR